VSRSPQERTFGQSPRSAREPLAGKAVLCDRSLLRGSDRLASDVAPLVQHIVHVALAYIVARRDGVLIFASPMSQPDINRVIERESVCHWSRLAAAITIPVTKAARNENSSRSCRMMTIGNLPTQRRAIAQSSIVAKATRQEKSSKSFRVLMDIGAPPYAASCP